MTPREIDVLVARKVMGWIRERDGWWRVPDGSNRWYHESATKQCGYPIPSFSTDIAAAWTVVEHREGCFHLVRLIGGGFRCTFNDTCQAGGPSLWDAAVYEAGPVAIYEAIADSAPLAICKAALKAVGVEVT